MSAFRSPNPIISLFRSLCLNNTSNKEISSKQRYNAFSLEVIYQGQINSLNSLNSLNSVEADSLVLAASFTPRRTEELSSINGVAIGNRELAKTTTAQKKG